ncbi:/ ssb / Helix-destabilizing protein /:30426 Forward [Candidatus Hepatoplasma crinochetorum]|uniref:Single-stranded DNA-binding protein n=1 Tax=Candidatus Hepatoplasma crinochetorum TaxID=295596 RepID=A0A0G7ZN84_9MOLU|nr:/ ssb / Helix-destabilizing protein /:30426 Forward [Candidatus Hepatoplasma crinochetorum]
MLNKVILIGRITNDIELRQTNEGTPLVYFTLAVNRRVRNNNNNNNQQQTDFVDCKAWRNLAETMSNYLKKGSLIAVEGRLEVFNSQSDNGQYNRRVSVVVDQFSFLESKGARTLELEANDYKESTSEYKNKSNSNKNSKDNSKKINFASESNFKENDDFDEINFDEINF